MAKGTKVGEILLEQGLIDEDQLQHALNEHRRTGLMLGKVIVRLGFVDEDTMASILGEQISLKQKKRLGDILVEQGTVTQADVDEALAMQKQTGQKLGKCLVELHKITGEQLLNILSAQLDIPQVKLKNYHFDHGAVALITEEMSRTHKVVPLYVRGKTLTIAMADPTDMRTVDYLRFKTQMNVDSVMATEDDINKAIESLYGVQNTGIDELIGEDKAAAKPEETPDANADDLDFSSEEGRKIVAIVNSIISEAVNGGVSDIHLEPEDNYLRLRTAPTANWRSAPPSRTRSPTPSSPASRSWRAWTSPKSASPRTAESPSSSAATRSTSASARSRSRSASAA